ncbi:hypothetical protein OK074_3235 [Actinobacteria bacterium OK074]|nr:hypothetical protein OK074_3235 [Actinobacteria bacterium OK074]
MADERTARREPFRSGGSKTAVPKSSRSSRSSRTSSSKRRTLPAATALAVLFSSAALAVTAPAPASADSAVTLPVASTGDVVVDGVHQRVFVSDPTTGKIVATDYAGAVVGTVDSLPGVRGLELSADSGTLYAAVGGADAIVAVDTATVTEAHRYATGDGTDPRYLAVTGGKVWFGYGTASNGEIGSLDLSGTDPVVALDQDTHHTFYEAPIVDASPAAPGTLVAGVPGQSPVELAVFDVSSGTADRTAYAFDPGSTGGGYLKDLAVTPDGKDVITASGSPYYQALYKLSDLTADGQYASTSYPNAVDIAPDGSVAAGADAAYDNDVYVYKQGASTPAHTYDLPGGPDAHLADAGLAWAPDESKLFAVSYDSANTYSLRVYDTPLKPASTLTLTAPATGTRAKPLTVTGTLTSTDSTAFPSGTTVTLTRTDDENPLGKTLGTATVAADGSFSYTDTPLVGGDVNYIATYAGDADHGATTVTSATTVVKRTATKVTLTNNGKVYTYGTKVTFTAHLGTAYKNHTVAIYSNPDGPVSNTLVKSGTVDANGNLSATVTLNRNTTVTAKFVGDTRVAAASATSKVGTQVKISTALSGYYASKSEYKQTYKVFHQSKDPVFNTTMSPNPDRKYRVDVQGYFEGSWQSTDSEYYTLSTSGTGKLTLTGTPPKGVRFRIRAAYVSGTTKSGDTVNTTTYGAWKYLIFTS